MDSNNWRAAQGQVPIQGQVIGGDAVDAGGGMEGPDWRTQLRPESRQRIINKILETLKRHLPFSGQEGLQELKKIAVRFEEKIYTAATSQSDYLRKISLKMLTMETKSQNPENPQDPGSQSMQPQMQNQVQQLPVPMVSNQSQIQQQILSQNIQDNIPPTGVPNSAGLTSAMPNSVGGMSQDSSSQTGNASGGDWQEVIYLKIKSMNEMYFLELNEMCQRVAAKLQQHDALPQQPKNEQIEKLRFLKLMLERLIQFLRTNKNDIHPSHKDKVVGVEKQIVNFLDSNRPRKPVQQQLTPAHMHAFQQSQQQQPQLSQVHTSDGQMNSQVQAMNAQSSSVTTQQNNLAMSSNPRMMDPLQPVSNIDPAQGNALTQMQQVAMSSLQQNPVSGSQQVNMNSISSQNGLQSIVNPLQSNSNILQPQQIKQEQQMYTTQQIKQQYQLQMQQQYIQRLLLQQQQGGQQQSGQLPAQQIMQFLLLFLFLLLLYYINGHC